MTILTIDETSAELRGRAAVRMALSRATAAVAAALARRKARYEARQVMGCDDILKDIGVCRGDFRRAIED